MNLCLDISPKKALATNNMCSKSLQIFFKHCLQR
jgi:hypothetical protein